MSFEIWIFRSGQPDCDDDRVIFVPMTSIEEQRSLALVVIASASELCSGNHCTSIAYELYNVNTIHW